MYDYHHRKKLNCTEEMLSKEYITATQNFLNFMLEKSSRSTKRAYNINCSFE